MDYMFFNGNSIAATNASTNPGGGFLAESQVRFGNNNPRFVLLIGSKWMSQPLDLDLLEALFLVNFVSVAARQHNLSATLCSKCL
jgi:hypothetical protein